MASMSRLLPAALAFVTACATVASPQTTVTPPPVATVPPATPTTAGTQPVEVQDCSAPPVTFSALCEVYELIEDRYVESPVDNRRLLDAALTGLDGYTTYVTEEPPRTLFCAVPDPDFEELCLRLAERVGEESLPIGPAIDAAVAAMVGLGLDTFSRYRPPGELLTSRSDGLVGGVGIFLDARDAAGSRCLRISPSCPLEVVFVLTGEAGARAGLAAGDLILAVNGEPVEGMEFIEAGAAIAGDETGVVELTVNKGDRILNFTIQRVVLSTPVVEYGLIQPGVAYLRIPDFRDDIPDLVEETLAIMLEGQPATIVIDLRDNWGGFPDVSVKVASMFIPDGTVMVTTSAREIIEHPVTREAIAPSQRLVVMVNRGTIASAEILAAALSDRRGAVLVGTPTFGKDVVQIPFKLRNGGELNLTVAHWTTPAGLSPRDGGLQPDRVVEWDANMTVEEAVDAALKVSP
jgi:carboxyl-terminal processing protease